MNPIFFRYGGLAIRYSQLIFLLAFILSYQLSTHSKKTGLSDEVREHALFYLLVGGLIGGRLSYFFVNWDSFSGRWTEGLTLWHGAFTLWGSLLGFWLTAKFGQKFVKLPQEIWNWTLNQLAFSFPLFLAVSQWSLWFEGEGWGKLGKGWGVLEQSGLSRYPIWLYFSLGYLAIGLYIFFSKTHKNPFCRMLTGISFINLTFTPWMFFVDSTTFILHLAWSSIYFIVSLLLIVNSEKSSNHKGYNFRE